MSHAKQSFLVQNTLISRIQHLRTMATLKAVDVEKQVADFLSQSVLVDGLFACVATSKQPAADIREGKDGRGLVNETIIIN